MKRVEREHQKEKQKLTKDKDAGTFHLSFHLVIDIEYMHSEESVVQGKSGQDEDGESRSRAAKGW